MVDEGFIAGWVERLRKEIPGTVAVVLKGSHARGSAGPRSDLDFDVLVFNEDIAHDYLTWIVVDGDGVSCMSRWQSIGGRWLAGSGETASWPFGLPSTELTPADVAGAPLAQGGA